MLKEAEEAMATANLQIEEAERKAKDAIAREKQAAQNNKDALQQANSRIEEAEKKAKDAIEANQIAQKNNKQILEALKVSFFQIQIYLLNFQ